MSWDWFASLAAVAALAAACSSEGNYAVEWSFVGDSAEIGCGAHGVFGVLITGVAAGGAGHEAVSPCTPGRFAHAVGPGTWTFKAHALDASGRLKEPDDGDEGGAMLNVQLPEVDIGEDATVVLAPVTFTAQPQCRDGVDNDRDGRIDLDDDGCTAPNGESELVLVPPPSP